VTIVGASLDESLTIPCRISADPADVSFEWTFANSGERYEVPSGYHHTTSQNFHSDSDHHAYSDIEESGTNGNGILIFLFSHSTTHQKNFQPNLYLIHYIHSTFIYKP
jgi:hypothetical protein